MQFVLQYTAWHYSRGIRDTVVLWSNIIWFLSHFFSLPLLSSTLFSPWKRLRESRKPGFDIEDLLAVLVVNVLMRTVGFFFRITLIAFGLLSLALSLALMALHLAVWIAFPVVVPALLYYGGVLLIT
jgi:hypothetical protein